MTFEGATVITFGVGTTTRSMFELRRDMATHGTKDQWLTV
jgi:hypothetical protein